MSTGSDNEGYALLDRAVLMVRYRPGSRGPEWTWTDEQIDVWNHGQRTRELLHSIAREGIREPVLLGYDGRVWDGHHRVCVAEWLGILRLPVEYAVDREPQPGDGPEYHVEHAAWERRQPAHSQHGASRG